MSNDAFPLEGENLGGEGNSLVLEAEGHAPFPAPRRVAERLPREYEPTP